MNKTTVSLSSLALLAAGTAHAQLSAYTPAQNQITVTPSYVYQTYDEFWAGNKRVKLPDDVIQHAGYLSLEYGILDDLALDLTMGYTARTPTPSVQGTTMTVSRTQSLVYVTACSMSKRPAALSFPP
jgi:hypothetical protein